MSLFSPLKLPNGSQIPNRIAKAAMEENMASADLTPSSALLTLYRQWSAGGAGLLISGNVMVERHAMTGPAGVVLDTQQPLEPFRQWASAGKQGGNQFWLQLNHPGRQMPANLGQPTLAPSAVPVQLGAMSRHFAPPQPMSATDIGRVQQQFVQSALLAEQAGFDGVQIHAAHGYLLSQFLSPLTNQRHDDWGGTLANRARLLLDIVRAVRAAVKPGFAVAVKLNSADFQRGGFSSEDAAQVVRWLGDLQIDLVELSGGSYEAPAMQGQSRDGHTLAREAYFLEFAAEIAQHATMPLMVTGGIRRRAVAEQVLQKGVAMVGIATALALQPALPSLWQQGQEPLPALKAVTWRNKALAAVAVMAQVKYQLRRHGKQRPAKPAVSAGWALLCQQLLNARLTRRYRKLMQNSL